MYDKLKAHGAEVLRHNFDIPMATIEELIASSKDSIDELTWMTSEHVEIMVALNSWTSYIAVAFSVKLGLAPDDKITGAINMAVMQMAAVAFEAGYHAGKMRGPVTDDEVNALFKHKEIDND